MYAVEISGTQTVFDLMRTQIKKIPLKLSQNDNLSTSIVWLLCQQSKVVTILMQLLIVSYYISCNILCIFSSYTINVYSVQCLLTKGLFMNLLVVCHFGLLNRHFASISGHIFFNLKLDVFHVLQPRSSVMFFLTFSLLLSMQDTKVWFNKP